MLPYKSHVTYLTNHMGSISHHMTPLVINSLGGGHTDTHTRHGQDQFLETRRAPAYGRCAPGLKSLYVELTEVVIALIPCSVQARIRIHKVGKSKLLLPKI